MSLAILEHQHCGELGDTKILERGRRKGRGMCTLRGEESD